VILGMGVDAIFKVSPWGVIIGLMLGFVTGVRNVVATAMKANAAADKKGEGDKA
jgi:F0F1-type ATP synthase assembly protein I